MRFFKSSKKVYVSNKKGKKAITNYHVLKNVKGYTLLDVFIETGRKNQIRVHLNDIGHQIVGDKKYGGVKRDPLRRLCLHANYLEFMHPVTGKKVVFETKIPNEFIKICEEI